MLGCQETAQQPGIAVAAFRLLMLAGKGQEEISLDPALFSLVSSETRTIGGLLTICPTF